MPSSISSSERATAADRPGVAQPVPERPVPVQPWRGLFIFAAVAVMLAVGAWEWRMRGLGLLPGDQDDGPALWARQRRRIDVEDVPIAIIGDSRILFDTDLDRFEALTGIRPVQLALPGTNAQPFLQDLAADAHFRGLALVGIKEVSYFRAGRGQMGNALDHARYESPATRAAQILFGALSEVFGFLDENYRLSNLVLRTDPGWRSGAPGPHGDVWKLRSVDADRQSRLWPRIESDEALRAQARAVWLVRSPPPPGDDLIAKAQAQTRASVAAIRARGGDVIFLRPPSGGALRQLEETRLPRARGWDPLLRAADVLGLHFDDVAALRDLDLPEDSHLSSACASWYTEVYVRELGRLTTRVHILPSAPAFEDRGCHLTRATP